MVWFFKMETLSKRKNIYWSFAAWVTRPEGDSSRKTRRSNKSSSFSRSHTEEKFSKSNFPTIRWKKSFIHSALFARSAGNCNIFIHPVFSVGEVTGRKKWTYTLATNFLKAFESEKILEWQFIALSLVENACFVFDTNVCCWRKFDAMPFGTLEFRIWDLDLNQLRRQWKSVLATGASKNQVSRSQTA